MATIRVARRRRYTSIDRRAINDRALSWRARGILHWLLDKPDDWTVDSKVIAAEGVEGREAVRTALNELVDAGYLVRRKAQGPDGRWFTETTVYENPGDAEREEPATLTEDGFPGVGSPDVGSPDVGPPGALPLEGLRPRTETLAAKGGRKGQWGDDAEALARGEWERRERKPVCGFPALATRCQEALDAGHSPAAIESAMASMSVFSRNAFDLALGERRERAATSTRRRIDSDRDGPAGRVEVS